MSSHEPNVEPGKQGEPHSAPVKLSYETPAVFEPPPAAHDPYAALRFRDYRFFAVGWLLAVLGQQMQSAALGWEIYNRTGSYTALGWLAGVQAIPLILLSLPAGSLADTFDRRRIATITAAFIAVCSVLLAILSSMADRGTGTLHWMYGVLILSSTAAVIGRPARASLMPQLLPMWAFSNAVTWDSSIFQLATVIGPMIAGGIIYFAGVQPVYWATAGCVIVYSLLLCMLRPAPQRDLKHADRSLAAGIRFVWRTRIILATLTLDLFAVLLGGAVYLIPVFAKRLGVGAAGFGALRAADAIGAVCMAMLLAHLPPMKKAGQAMLLAVAGFGAATIIFGLSTNFWLSLVALFLVGAFDNVSVVVRHTLVQVLTPDEMRGRVSAVNSVFIGASNEIGGLESGLTAEWFGPVASVVGGGIGTILVVLGVGALFPQVRAFGSLSDAKPEEEKPQAA